MTKQSAPFVLEGSGGMVFFPPLRCKSGLSNLTDDPNFYKDCVTKLMISNDAKTKNEIEKNIHVNLVDPDAQYHILAKYNCSPSDDDNTIARVNNSRGMFHVSKETLADGSFILLLMGHGGMSLNYWCMEQHSDQEIKQVFIESYRVLRGLYDLQQPKNEKQERGFFVHGDVLATNIVYDKEKNRLNLVDFGNSVYSNEIDPKNKEGYNQVKIEGYGLEWSVLNDYEDYMSDFDYSKEQSVQDIISDMKVQSLGGKLCQVIYLASSKNPKKMHVNNKKVKQRPLNSNSAGEDENDKNWCSHAENSEHVQKFWKDLNQMILNTMNKESDYTYNNLLQKAIETNDMYGMGYTLLMVLGGLRQSSQSEMHEKNGLKNIYAEILKLCLKVVTGNVLERLSWLKLLSQYEDIFLRHRIFREDPLERAKALPDHDYGIADNSIHKLTMRDLLRRLGAEAAKEWDLQKQIEYQMTSVPSEETSSQPSVFWDEFQNNAYYYNTLIQREHAGGYLDLGVDKCLSYLCITLNKFIARFQTLYILQYYDDDDVYTEKGNGSQTTFKYPWILVDTEQTLVSVFWPRPQSVAWVWGLDNDKFRNRLIENINTLNNDASKGENDYKKAENLSQEYHKNQLYTEQEVEFVTFACNENTQISFPEDKLQKLSIMTKLTCMVLEIVLQKEETLNKNVKRVACLIRDHWAERLSMGLNALMQHERPIRLDFFRGIFHTISSRNDDVDVLESLKTDYCDLMTTDRDATSSTDTQEKTVQSDRSQVYFQDPSWLMRGLAEYTNAYFLAMGDDYDSLPHLLCVFMPSEVDSAWENEDFKSNYITLPYPWFMPKNGKVYFEKVKFIVHKLKIKKEVHVILPEALFNDIDEAKKYYYVRWFLYTFCLVTDKGSTTLIITTPRDHVFEVTRGFARKLIADIKSTLGNESINIIRQARLQDDGTKSAMPLFVESLSSSWFTNQEPPSNNVRAWLGKCEKFLRKCKYDFDRRFDLLKFNYVMPQMSNNLEQPKVE